MKSQFLTKIDTLPYFLTPLPELSNLHQHRHFNSQRFIRLLINTGIHPPSLHPESCQLTLSQQQFVYQELLRGLSLAKAVFLMASMARGAIMR